MGIKRLKPTSPARRYQTYLTRDDFSMVAVDHDACEEAWEVAWQVAGGHNELWATFSLDLLAVLDDGERSILARLGTIGPPGDTDQRITTTRPSVATLRDYVNVTGPIARAAIRRITEANP